MEPLKEGVNTGRCCEADDPKPLYAITIKPTYNSYKKKVEQNPQLLVSFFHTYCEDKGYIPRQHTIEIDSKGISHLHGVMTATPMLPNPTKYYAGWHIFVKHIYELVGWDSYIQKDQGKDPITEYAFI